MPKEFSVMGKGLPRADAIEKVKGEAIFASDRQQPRMLHVKFLRSPYPHAKIIDIETTQAEELPGVKAILTFKNVPKIRAYSAVVPSREKFEYLLDETLHYAGEEIAAVAATTKETAEEALGLIKVEYEILPAIFDKEAAMSPEAPLVYPELGSNLYQGRRILRLDADGQFQVANRLLGLALPLKMAGHFLMGVTEVVFDHAVVRRVLVGFFKIGERLIIVSFLIEEKPQAQVRLEKPLPQCHSFSQMLLRLIRPAL